MEKTVKHRKWLPWVILTVIAVGGLIYWNYQQRAAEQEPKFMVYTLKQRDPLVLKGASEVTEAVSVSMDPAKGEVDEVLVHTGDKVAVGDELFTYWNSVADDRLADAERQLKRSEEAVSSARSDLKKAESDQKDDTESLRKAKDRLATSRDELRSLQKDLAEAQSKGDFEAVADLNDRIQEESDNISQYSQDSSRYQAKVDSWPDRIDALEKSLDQAEKAQEDGAVQLSRAESDQRQVETADIAGYVRVTETNRRNPQLPLVEIVSQDTEIRATVTEYDYFRIRSGEKIRIRLVATQEEMSGTITEVEPLPQSGQSLSGQSPSVSSVNYAFTVRPERPVQPGYSADIEIDLPETVVPSTAIVQEGSENFLWVYSDGSIHKSAVTLGQSGAYRVLEGGLENGTVILLSPDPSLQDGQSVRIES